MPHGGMENRLEPLGGKESTGDAGLRGERHADRVHLTLTKHLHSVWKLIVSILYTAVSLKVTLTYLIYLPNSAVNIR